MLVAGLIVWRSSDAYQLASLNQRLSAQLDSIELSQESIASIDAVSSEIARIAPEHTLYNTKRINEKLVSAIQQKINQPRLQSADLKEIEEWIAVVGKRSKESVTLLNEAYQAG